MGSGQTRATIAKVGEYISLVMVAVLTALKGGFPDAPAQPSSLMGYLHVAFLHYQPWAVGAFSLAGIFSKWAQGALRPESKMRTKACLDAFSDLFFVVPAAERYENRVTLFKANEDHTKLEPFCRAGDTYQRNIQSFKIDDNDEKQNESITGEAWFKNATVRKTFPDCPSAAAPGDPAFLAYVDATGLSPEKVGKLHVKSRAVLATPIRNVHGAKWGVLTLDSRNEHGLDANEAKMELLNGFAAALGKML